MEGDFQHSRHPRSFLRFQSTPSVWRETMYHSRKNHKLDISIHSLRMEGDSLFSKHFTNVHISIHSLRMEGDTLMFPLSVSAEHFNPLPPYGGRLMHTDSDDAGNEFQSTPSVWRETNTCCEEIDNCLFQSTPSVWRETRVRHVQGRNRCISIHSLRMEGD